MAENSESESEKDPLHDPFDMLSGNTPPPEKKPTPEKKEEETTPGTGGGVDPFDMVEKHDTPGTTTPTTPVTTPQTPANTGENLPEKTEDPKTPEKTEETTTNQPELPKPNEDPLLATQPGTTPTTTTPSTPTTTTPPPSTPTPQPVATPTPTPQPTTTTTPVAKKKEPTREAYESKINLDAVIAAANQQKTMPDIELSDMENLDKKLFQKTNRQKASPAERGEAEAKLAYLEKKINADLAFYKQKEKRSGKGTLIFSVLSSLLAASVTVLLGLNVTDWMRSHNVDWYINTVALVISAFISVIGVVQNFTDSKPLWIKYTDAINQYQHLLDNIEFMRLAGEYITLDDVIEIKLAYNKIKSGTNNYIIQVRSQDDGGPTNMLRT